MHTQSDMGDYKGAINKYIEMWRGKYLKKYDILIALTPLPIRVYLIFIPPPSNGVWFLSPPPISRCLMFSVHPLNITPSHK